MKSILGSLLLITEGSLLVKYLGVTLTTRRLKTEDCNQFKKKRDNMRGKNSLMDEGLSWYLLFSF